MDTILHQFGENVRQARLARGWSQERLAEAADLDRTYISGIERGVRNPTLTTVARLAGALGMAVPDLLSSADEPSTAS